MNSINKIKQSPETGTTLLIVLLLVFISGLLGVAAFNDSTVSLKIAANDMQRETVFRAAESQSNLLLDPNTVQTLINSTQQSMTDTTSLITNVSTEAQLRIQTIGLARGFSIGEGIGGFASYKLTSEAQSTIPAIRATKTVTQGAEQLAPKP